MGAGTIVLLVAAIQAKEAKRCKGIEINIKGVNNNFFVDKNDILNHLNAIEKINPVGKPIGAFNLRRLETELEKDIWVKGAELFFDNNEVLQVMVEEREPIARVFSTGGTTFYVDNDLTMLPLSEKFSARLPVFTGFPSDKKVLSNADSILLSDIKILSLAIQEDSFCMALIEQVDINQNRQFEFIPKLGNQIIVFGNAANIAEKLRKLKLFYQEVMVKAGWSNYSVINVEYKNQVVAKIRGAEDVKADSLRALQIMQVIVDRAQKNSSDSLQTMMKDNERNSVDSSMIQQSIQRDDNVELPNTNEKPIPQVVPTVQPVTKPAVKDVQKKLDKSLPVKKETEQPKAVMKKKNEY